MYLRGNSIGTDDDDDDDADDGRRTKDDGHTLNLSIYLIAGQYVPVLSGCSCRGVWLAPIKRMGITDRNKYVESGGAGRAGRPADQIMVTQSLTQAFVC